MTMTLESLGLIGNCQYAALIDATGEIVWCCLPRFDSPPVFGRLIDPEGGGFRIGTADGARGEQRYVSRTNVLETTFVTDRGRFRVTDFAPRFEQDGRMFRPSMLVREIEVLDGRPDVSVHCDPVLGWSKAPGFASDLRLWSDLPRECLDGKPFALTGKHRVVLAWGDCGDQAGEVLDAYCDRLRTGTLAYWLGWADRCTLPAACQDEALRSALVLKLQCFEETGAIVAAVTTSIPESAGAGRNWDYRYCWMRDSYYIVDALRKLGQFDEGEDFIKYLLRLVDERDDVALAPLYTVTGELPVAEHIPANWAGFNGDGPVRVGNAAMSHQQHDIFGELVLAMTPLFEDPHFRKDRPPAALDLLMRLAERAARVAGTPDSGIWEFRTAPVPQTFSSLMCWAATDRAAKIAQRLRPQLATGFRADADRIRREIVDRAWSERRQSYVGTYDHSNLDASILQMAPLGIFPPDDSRLQRTIESIRGGLSHNGWLMRYADDDGFGMPTVAFIICTFWLVEALAYVGRASEARDLLETSMQIMSPLGLISEDFDMANRRLLGNFPQAYSHVGLVKAAFSVHPR
jgi:GH15 family glucan-1,4-alpha-glucosidase